jgi:hypothetical protein
VDSNTQGASGLSIPDRRSLPYCFVVLGAMEALRDVNVMVRMLTKLLTLQPGAGCAMWPALL